jgi:hypothetical protein
MMIPIRFDVRVLAPLVLMVAGLWTPALQAAGVLEFLEPRMNLREGESRDITVIRSGDSAGEVTVVLNVSLGGTATLGEDYTVELPLGVIRILDGQLSGRARVNALENNQVEGTKYTVFTLANPSGAALARQNNLLLQIEDDDAPDVSFEFPGEAVRRVQAGDELSIEVARSGAAPAEASVVLLGVPDTAALGIDYSDLTTTLEFAPQEDSAQATLSTLAGASPAGPRALSLLLADPVPAGEAAFSGVGPMVIIEDAPADRAGEFSLFTDTPRVEEGDGTVVFTVDRNRGSAGAATVSWVTVDGTDGAVAGVDYAAATGTLAFAAGETRKTFAVELVAGEATRPQRQFEVVLANPSEFAGLDPEGRRSTVTILADDRDPSAGCKGFCDCFIASAAWGSWMDPHVATLRNFRDRVLMRTAPGRGFVSLYYRYSPPLAAWISQSEFRRAAARTALTPVVLAIEWPLAAAGLLLGIAALVNLRRRAWRTPLA